MWNIHREDLTANYKYLLPKQSCMLFTLKEFFDVIMMTIGVGFIFMNRFGIPAVRQSVTSYIEDPVAYYQQALSKKISRFDWNSLWIACLITAPAVIFHELAHKLAALSYGLQATFHAAYFWLSFGIIMKLLNTGFIFFVPGYVSFSAPTSPMQSALIAFAGPFLNLVLWFTCWAILKFKMITMTTRTMHILAATRFINGFLFIFNMIPLGFFDGAKVLEGVVHYFSG
jgi:Zn-dependent protease